MVVEFVCGQVFDGYVIDVSDLECLEIFLLVSVIVQELRGCQLNFNWIKLFMLYGYVGVWIMSIVFFENLWGWEIIDFDFFFDKIWDDVKVIYIND